MTHNFCCNMLWFCPILSKQQQTSYNTPQRCNDGEVTGKLGRGANIVSKINTWYSQECHIGIQQYSGLEEWNSKVIP